MRRFLKRLLGLTPSRCECQTGTHGHPPEQCPNDAQSGYLCRYCFAKKNDRDAQLKTLGSAQRGKRNRTVVEV